MRCATLLAGLVVVPAALALALPGDIGSSYGLSPFEQDDFFPESNSLSTSLSASDSAAAKADQLNKDDEANKNLDFANVQFSDVNYDSTQLKDNEHESDNLKQADSDQDQANKLQEKEAASCAKNIEFAKVKFRYVKFDATEFKAHEHKKEKLKAAKVANEKAAKEKAKKKAAKKKECYDSECEPSTTDGLLNLAVSSTPPPLGSNSPVAPPRRAILNRCRELVTRRQRSEWI
ncbi:hypothetical protein JCM21900_004147 [Sporobolomyces salmonicolor]